MRKNMGNAIFNNPGNTMEGRIERLQIMRSDGTIRESKKVNIHNTIVNSGLDNILTIGGFTQGSNTNDRVANANYYNSGTTGYYPVCHYINALWLRMLWFMKIGTDHNNNITLYDMTDLVEPYINADQETFSQSHYIPTTANTAIRGTTYDSMIQGDIHSTHRITSNSIKVTEDNTEITEIGFFVGINTTWSSNWTSQVFTPGDMFCRINLGEHKVTLNAGERLVVTYALTEYAGASTHQAVNDIHLVDANGNPIKYKDGDGIEHTIGAIARNYMCDGRMNLGYNTTPIKPLPGDFYCIHPTQEWGYCIGRNRYTYNTDYAYFDFTTPAWANLGSNQGQVPNNRMIMELWNWNSYQMYTYCCQFRMAYHTNLFVNGNQYNPSDEYGFPSINTKTSTPYYGSSMAYTSHYGSSQWLSTAGRCNNNATNPTPYNNYTGGYITSLETLPTPTIKPYTRGTFYRDQEWVMPTYYPNYGSSQTNTLPDPRSTANIYWINIRGMLYKIGYFLEEGNLSTFVPCPITKKRGQVFRCTFREYVGRHVAGA